MPHELKRADALAQEQLGARIRIARKGVNLTAEDLARHLGLTSKTVRAWEKGEREPRANQITMMAGVLNVTAPWLLEGRSQESMEADSEEAVLRGKVEAAKLKTAELNELILDIESRLYVKAD
ncbi:MAG: helix-turn-helix transcriptional regulator [Alphaproteobacteria bacterium]|nr:helix-turn-helix transcriptional regulator [Alphaproteobacteria bacterium]